MRAFVVMGVAGCGKSTVGAAVARRIGATYIDGDDLHPPANIAKMSAGQPLTDADRAPWLHAVGEELRDHPGRTLIGCSALRRAYRDIIRDAAREPVGFLHLSGSRALIETRMKARKGHFMPLSLLDSQFATLEPLQDDEIGLTVDIDRPFSALVRVLEAALRSA
ncbi:gluconokinase [Pseudoruegeria sp. HB172150]|uniref:gluconokinase n=1 Tax=Pseudoruegeria sp. HB172150 TaxID=2721164 RepID=UPI001C1317F1|nr:gluconokinase [Pseudoruegeria sp. HB172150]